MATGRYQARVADDPSSRSPVLAQDQSFGLLTLLPTPPIFGWLAQLDAAIRDPAVFPASRLIVLDLSLTTLHAPGIRTLVTEMETRGIRVAGLAGLDPSQLGEHAAQMPPILPASSKPRAALEPPAPTFPEPANLLIEENIRSGRRVYCPAGDVTVVGSVSSGAEIVAGGSVHVYGKLRGRAVAGLAGGPAQIFCRALDAELLSINGVSLIADDMDANLLGRAVRAWNEGDVIRLCGLD
jgi:septum site-determining protein MinC